MGRHRSRHSRSGNSPNFMDFLAGMLGNGNGNSNGNNMGNMMNMFQGNNGGNSGNDNMMNMLSSMMGSQGNNGGGPNDLMGMFSNVMNQNPMQNLSGGGNPLASMMGAGNPLAAMMGGGNPLASIMGGLFNNNSSPVMGQGPMQPPPMQGPMQPPPMQGPMQPPPMGQPVYRQHMQSYRQRPTNHSTRRPVQSMADNKDLNNNAAGEAVVEKFEDVEIKNVNKGEDIIYLLKILSRFVTPDRGRILKEMIAYYEKCKK